MYGVVLFSDAEIELNIVGEWYDGKVPGLSLHFFDEIEEHLQLIQNNLFAFSMRKEGSIIRSCSLKKFPYNIYFIAENDSAFVLAILHKSRSSRFVKKRLK